MNVCDNIFGADFASLQTDTKTTDDDCIEQCIREAFKNILADFVR